MTYKMGVYLNPGNNGFTDILGSKYVDKTGIIGLINSKRQIEDGLKKM